MKHLRVNSYGLIALLLGLCFSYGTPAWADVRAGLYQAIVPVADRSGEAQHHALRQALGEVLVRLTGDAAIGSRPVAKSLSDNVYRYVQQYGYEGNESTGLKMRVGFDGAALEAALRAEGLALWGRARPPVLLWMAVDDGQQRYLLGSDSAATLYNDVQQVAQQRGLSLILPLLDLQDQAQVGYSDVWGGFVERITPASARYQAQVLLLARVQRLGSAAWSSRWTLHMNGQTTEWSAGGAAPEAMLQEGLGQAAQRLSAQLAAPSAGLAPGAQRLIVEGLDSLADYAEVDQYLTGLTPVRSAQLVAVKANGLEYRVDVQGGADALDQAARLGGLLFRVEGPPATGEALAQQSARPLYYRLRR